MTLPDAEPSSVAQPAPVVPPSLPKIEAPRILSRADIIALGNRAADALTSGVPLPPDVINAAGRRYDVILPFGCDGPAPEESTAPLRWRYRSEEHTSELQSLMRISYAVFCLKKKQLNKRKTHYTYHTYPHK